MISCATMSVSAQREYSKDCIKTAQKTAKTRAKELKKEKWEYSGALTLETELEKFSLKTIDDCGDYMPNVQDFTAKSISVARNNATVAAIRTLAVEMQTTAMGKIASETTDEDDRNVNQMAAQYKGELAACLHECFYVSKKGADGKYNVKVYFTVDKEKFNRLAKKLNSNAKEGTEWSDDIFDSVKRAHED